MPCRRLAGPLILAGMAKAYRIIFAITMQLEGGWTATFPLDRRGQAAPPRANDAKYGMPHWPKKRIVDLQIAETAGIYIGRGSRGRLWGMRLARFSLRSLLLLTAFVAVFCYWRDRPRQIANRFVAAIEAGDYELAESMFIKPTPLEKTPLKGDAATYPQTFTEWLTGSCRVRYSIPVAWSINGMVTATAEGLQDLKGGRLADPLNIPYYRLIDTPQQPSNHVDGQSA